jgi:hypothetical protein
MRRRKVLESAAAEVQTTCGAMVEIFLDCNCTAIIRSIQLTSFLHPDEVVDFRRFVKLRLFQRREEQQQRYHTNESNKIFPTTRLTISTPIAVSHSELHERVPCPRQLD